MYTMMNMLQSSRVDRTMIKMYICCWTAPAAPV